jgi:DNA modification methylase
MTPFVFDPDFTLYCGDVREVLAGLPDESVHCVVTSPPYWGLRDYGTGAWEGGDAECDHHVREDAHVESSTLGGGKATTGHQREGFKDACGRCGARRTDQQLGLEPTPEAYVQNMVAVFREVRRVLRKDGSCWLNIGDSYVGSPNSGGLGPHQDGPDYRTEGVPNVKARIANLKPKNLVGIPWRLAFALQADGWYLRADVIWSKPNPMPESVTDRPTKAHEYIFMLTRSPRYFFDQEAVREPLDRVDLLGKKRLKGVAGLNGQRGDVGRYSDYAKPAGRNIRSVWEIATQPYAEAHFATFPEALVERCIKAGTSERGCCPECGAPWERETERKTVREHGGTREMTKTPLPVVRAGWRNGGPSSNTVGWSLACRCETLTEGGRGAGPAPSASVPCTVLDPFMGSGTTALVARRHNRKTIGIELSLEYAKLAARRLQQLSLLAS